MLNHLIRIIKETLKHSFDIEDFERIDFSLKEVLDPKLGDLAFSCFEVFNSYKFTTNSYELEKKKSAIEIAESLAGKIKPDEYIEKVEAVGPYLNFFLRKEKVFEEVCRFGVRSLGRKKKEITSQIFYLDKIWKLRRKKIVLEFSQPNTNKPLHLGHLRNTILGNSIANLLKSTGNKVIRANLINDRGIHICKSMLAYESGIRNQESRIRNQESDIKAIKGDHLVGEYYTMFNKMVKDRPELLDEAQEMLRKWEAGDKKILALANKMNKWALTGFKETYKRLGIKFDKWYYESKIYKKGRKIILDALKERKCYKRKDGAVEVELGDNLSKKVLLRLDGTSVYITQDIALAKLKFDQYKPNKSIYLTGHEQEYHFKVLFKILQCFGFPWAEKCKHLWHGMVFLPKGKMKSREGKVVEADRLMDEMRELAKKEILKRSRSSWVAQEPLLLDLSEKIAQAALKFYLLKFNPKQEINFKPKESLSFKEATGIYVMYAYVRIQSIINKFQITNHKFQVNSKFKIQNSKPKKINFSCLYEPEEWEIGKLLLWFPEIVKKSALNYNPSYLTEHLLKLAGAFNKFYEKHSVLSAKSNDLIRTRLVLITATAQALKKGMELLGIEVKEKM